MSSEFDRQVETLRAKGYPDEVLSQVEPLRERVPDEPFVVVVPRELVPWEESMPLVELGGAHGYTDMDDLDRFQAVDGVEAPGGSPYLVTGVDTGADTLNVTPDDAMGTIVGAGRSPLTIDEGVALVLQHPEVLKEKNCFSMLGSRCADRRVTAMWVSRGRPRLGWCWAGNPHTWLGSASCAERIAPRPRSRS